MDLPASGLVVATKRARVVLDTNAVLDWLIFKNPDCASLEKAIFDGSVRLLTSTAMRGELSHVLARGVVNRWVCDFSLLWKTLDRHAELLPDPPAAPATTRMRCTDADDQKFIDFALAHQAHWLLTRDRALLKLHKKALAVGLRIARPRAWTPPDNAATADK